MVIGCSVLIGLNNPNESNRSFRMSEKKLSAQFRTEDFGSAGSRRVLRSGRIPAVIYGKNTPVHITLDAKEFENKMRHFSETTLLTISAGDKEFDCLMKDFQEDLLRGAIRHVDFFEVTRGQVLRTHVGITLDGTPAGVRDGGVLEQILHEIEIECLPKDLPEVLIADVSGLKINESLQVGALAIPAGVKFLIDPDSTVATVKSIKEEAPAVETDAAAEAEVTTGAAAADADKDEK